MLAGFDAHHDSGNVDSDTQRTHGHDSTWSTGSKGSTNARRLHSPSATFENIRARLDSGLYQIKARPQLAGLISSWGPGMEAQTVKRVHLILSAGGVHTISFVGAINALSRAGVSFSSVSACSSATFLAGLVCAGVSPSELHAEVMEVDIRKLAGKLRLPWGLLPPLHLLKWPFSRYQQSGLSQRVVHLVGSDPRLGDLKIPFGTAAIDLLAKRMLAYSTETHPEMRLSEAIDIAIGAPGLYPPYTPTGRIVIDAALAVQSPVWLASRRDDGLPIVTLRCKRSRREGRFRSFNDYIMGIWEASTAIREDALFRDNPRIRLVEIEVGDLGHFDFSRAERDKSFLMRAGEDAVEATLASSQEIATDNWTERVVPNSEQPVDRDTHAERAGTLLVAQFNSGLGTPRRHDVFISYSHLDRKWLDTLKTALAPVVRYLGVQVWEDTQIAPGGIWRDEIAHAIKTARIAILLVTPAFLDSDFVAEEELPLLLEQHRQGRLLLLWLAVKHSDWKHTPLLEVQAINDASVPMEALSEAEQNKLFVEICDRVAAAMKASEARPRAE